MAKKDKKKDDEKKGSKIGTLIMVLLIIVGWIGIMILLVKLDVGHFGSQVLRPVLKDVPVINKILPAASEDEMISESNHSDLTLSQALDKIKLLEDENTNYKSQVDALNETITDQQTEISRLKVFEDNQTQFQASKDDFYAEIVYGENAPSTEAYIEWYNSIDKASAEAIYEKILGQKANDEQITELSKTYAAMKPAQAASILQTMTNDLDTVADILNGMNAQQRGDILGQMDPDFAASVTKKLLP